MMVKGHTSLSQATDYPSPQQHQYKYHGTSISTMYHVESGEIAVEICFICDKVFYSKEDLDNHKQLDIQCSICKVCATEGGSEFDYCAAMEHAEKLTPRGFFGQLLKD